MSVRPRTMRDVPAERLAFRFEPDIDANNLPASFNADETEEPLASVKSDFETRRKDEALMRTVVSPDGQRALALYATADTAEGDYRIDMYSAEGQFLRNVLPVDLTGTFPQWVAWSGDSQRVAFIGVRNATPTPTPTPLDEFVPPVADAPPPVEGAPTPAASVAPIIAPVQTFSTEQIYVCDRDGYNIRPLTTRDGLIYFQFEWAPDNHAVAALACKPGEWDARRSENKTPAGRPRLIDLEGRERLLSDQLADAAPVWSPDSSKVAAAFDTSVVIYDATGDAPTGASIPLGEPLLASSARYDSEKLSKSTEANQAGGGDGGVGQKQGAASPSPTTTPATNAAPLSFNPIVRLEWLQPETLLLRTEFLRLYKGGEFIHNYPRWHILHLSPQAIVLGARRPLPSRPHVLLVSARRAPHAGDTHFSFQATPSRASKL